MDVQSLKISKDGAIVPTETGFKPHLILYFSRPSALVGDVVFNKLSARFPDSHIVGCTTGGHFAGATITEEDAVATAIRFSGARIELAEIGIDSPARSFACGVELARMLDGEGLVGVFVLSDGLNVNGSQLAAGLSFVLGSGVSISGGLAGDGTAFSETLVGSNGPPRPKRVAAIGFYGASVQIVTGCAGGWDAFGPRRRITRSVGSILLQLDGRPALDLYEHYLGEEDVAALPGSALLYPLKVSDPARPEIDLVRTVLAVDRQARTMTFAGDMPEGWGAQLMRGNMDRLAAGAAEAARQARGLANDAVGQELAILVSCIGRRLLMGKRAEDEIEAAVSELGPSAETFGFYSYGELAPHPANKGVELHNQTMTVTLISEAA